MGGVRPNASENSHISLSTTVRATRVDGSRPNLASVLQEGRKTRVFTPVREPSEESRVKLSDVLDSAKLSRFQYGVFALCALAVFVEGFDTQVIGYVAPALGKAWALRQGALGPVFVGGLFGLLGGSLLIAPLADRFGRRTIILWSTLSFGILTLVTVFADSLSSLLVIRFLTGLGLGGAMPNAIALCAEYALNAVFAVQNFSGTAPNTQVQRTTDLTGDRDSGDLIRQLADHQGRKGNRSVDLLARQRAGYRRRADPEEDTDQRH